VNVIWQKNYSELAAAGRKTAYQAIVRKHHWPDYWIFQVVYNSGGCATECLSTDKDALVGKAEAWLAGANPEDFYSASI
jgi:hypothetical protein